MAIYEELEIDQGSTFKYVINLTESNEAAYNLDNFTVTGHIRRNHMSETTSATFSTSVTDSGEITLLLADSDTGLLTAGRYVYDVLIESPTNEKYRVIEGTVTVTPSVTRY